MANTSVYLGCQIQDDIASSLSLVKGELAVYQKDLLAALDAIKPTIDRIVSGTDSYATKTLGSIVENQVIWTAKLAGRSGNSINITYLYLGVDVDLAGNFVARPTSTSVDGNYITITLAVDTNGNIDPAFDTAASLAIWLSDPQVAALVDGTLQAAGTAVPEPISSTFLEGGATASMKNSETAANAVSKIFKKNSYTELLSSINVPVVTSAEEARQYLNENEKYVIINGNLFIVEGTNLVGINKMYDVVGKDLTTLKKILLEMDNLPNAPFLLITQNVVSTRVAYVCGRPESLTTVSEVYRGYNKNIWTIANQYAGGNALSLNLYIFWSDDASATQRNYLLLRDWSIPDEYRGDILVGDNPPAGSDEGNVLTNVPSVYTVEDPNLLVELGATNAEIVELIESAVEGIVLPKNVSIEDRAKSFEDLTKFDEKSLPNGLTSGLSKSSAAAQAVNLGDTLDDDGLAKELATRGKACARQSKNFADELIPDVNFDPVNIPTPDLPDAAKQIESAFGALASVSNTVNRIFDLQFKATLGIFAPLLNKIQNIMSLSDNLFKNKLADCLLGTGTDAVGVPEPPPFGSGVSPGISIPDVTGGLPIPTSLLKDALKDLTLDLDESVTSSFETVMDLTRTPLCIVQAMMESVNGFKPPSLGSVLDSLNPCKDGKDSESNCPAEETQEIISASAEMTTVMKTIPRIEDLPTEKITEEVSETIEHFTGFLDSTTSSVENTIDRGVKQVMDDIQKSLDAKLKQVDQLRKAVKDMFGEASEISKIAEDSLKESAGCGSTTIGAFTDAITDFIG